MKSNDINVGFMWTSKKYKQPYKRAATSDPFCTEYKTSR